MTIVRKDTLDNLNIGGGNLETFLMYTASNSSLLPNWWSERREQRLRQASIENDFLSSVIQTLVMKLFTLPLKVIPKNQYINAAVNLASTYDTILQNSWNANAELFLNDIMTFDKGGFLLIEGNNNISTPLANGEVPTGFRHIPSQNIQLLSNKEHPYQYVAGNRNIKIHASRIIRLTTLPTSIAEDAYVGLSFVSRAFNVSQLMMSSIQYGLEALGRIESDQIIWGTSITSQAIKQAFKDAQIDSTNSGFRANGKRVFLGMRDPAAKLNVLQMKRLPDGFNYDDFLRFTIKYLAIAAGIDEDDIAATSSAGTTKTATLISDLKSRFKLVAWFTSRIEKELNQKFLPSNLIMQIGDTSGEINESEAKTRINIARTDELLNRTGALTIRAARQNAVTHGFITQQQFVSMELDDGRLENGMPVYTLFFSNNEMIQTMLNIGVSNPCNVDTTKIQRALERANDKLCEAEQIAINTTSDNIFNAAKQVRAALLWFIETYDTKQNMDSEPEMEDEEVIEKASRPTSKRGRAKQSAMRKVIKNVWSKDTDTLKISIQDILDGIEDSELSDMVTTHSVELEDFLYYLESNTQEKGAKLSDIYSKLDKIFTWN